jgi:hypothetical protein
MAAAVVQIMDSVTNADFLGEIYGELGNSVGFVCAFAGNPLEAVPDVWSGRPYGGKTAQAKLVNSQTNLNTYYAVATFAHDADGELKRTQACFQQLRVLVADDVPAEQYSQCSYYIETSPGNGQAGVLLDPDDPDTRDARLIKAVLHQMSARGLISGNDRSGNNLVRWVRQPNGINGKPRASGVWHCKLRVWAPRVRLSLEDAAMCFGIDIDALREQAAAPPSQGDRGQGNAVVADWLTMLTHPDPSQRAYHESLTRWSASMIASGMKPGAVVETLRGVMSAARPGDLQELQRWQARFNDIPRIVDGAAKFAPIEKATPVIALKNVIGDSDLDADKPTLLLDLFKLQERAGHIKWLIKGAVPDDSVGMVFGASGTFKSFVALDQALHIAHGMQWMGRKTRQGAVVYVAAEGGAGIHRRVSAWHQHHGRSSAGNFFVCITPLILSESQHVEFLAEQIGKLEEVPALIVIDTLSQTFDGDENAATDISNYLRLVNTHLRARFQCCVQIVHHSGHAATERPRGSSAITANVDFMFGMFKPDIGALTARMETIKQKDGEKLPSQTFALQREVLGHDEDGDEITSLVACWSDAASNLLASAAHKLNQGEQILLDALTQAGGSVMEMDLRHTFYNALGAATPGREFNPSTARKSFLRAMTALRDKSLIHVNVAGRVTLRAQQENEE